MSIERQARIIIGLLVFAFVTLSVVDQRWILGTAAMGVGLVLTGLTDWCGTVRLLSRMPWNRAAGRVSPRADIAR